jgi:hypothetical protein
MCQHFCDSIFGLTCGSICEPTYKSIFQTTYESAASFNLLEKLSLHSLAVSLNSLAKVGTGYIQK